MNRLLIILKVAWPSLLAQSISGTVTAPDRSPVPGVSVRINGPQGRLSATTDSLGFYQLPKLLPGPQALTFVKDGFQPGRQAVTVSSVNLPVDITLELASIGTAIVVEDVAGKSTGARIDVAAVDLPVQVSSVPQIALLEQGVNSMVDALRNVSGVTAQRWFGMYEYYTVRGFQIADVQLVDGMRLEGNRVSTQLNNVEQVDVLKGPSSMLYGGQALSGAINIIRKKPQAIRAYDLFYRAGRFRSQQVGGGLTGPVFGSPRLLYRLDTSLDDAAGWRQAGARRLNLSPTLTWLISDRQRVTVHQAFNRDRFTTDAGLPDGVLGLSGFSLSRRFNTSQDFGLVHDSQTHVLYNANISSAFELRNGFFYRYSNDQYYSAETLTYRPALQQVDRQFLYFKHHRRPVLNQADLVGRVTLFGMKHSFVAGHEYQDFYNFTHRSASRSVNIPPISLSNFEDRYIPVPDFPLSRIDYFSNRINAFFWQDQISLAKNWKLNVGGRFDDFRRATRNDPWANGARSASGVEGRRNQQAYTYRAGLVYAPRENQQFYFSSASSFQPVTQLPADGRELLPETGRSFEVGHRAQLFGGRFTTSVAAYQIRRENVVIARPNQQFDQAGAQSSRGIDLDLNGKLPGGVSLIANYGYTQPRFDQFFAANGAVNLSGFRPRFTQRHAANSWLTKSWNSGVRASLGSRYVSSVFTSNANTLRIGGYFVVNGAFGYAFRRLDWSVNAENLLDRQRYFLAGIYDNQLYPGSPLNIFTTLRFRF